MLCAIGVLFAHSYVLVSNRPNIKDPFQLYFNIGMGTFFVTIFFSISGFLIYRSLDRSHDLQHYVLARSKRIFPALSVVLLLTVFILGPFITELDIVTYFSTPSTWQYLLNINLLDIHTHFKLPGVFIENPHSNSVNGSLWTLPIETWMYVMTALAFCLSGLTKHYLAHWQLHIKLTSLVCFILIACLTAKHFQNTHQFEKFDMLIFICTFTVGSILYKLRYRIPVMWSIAGLLLLGIPWLKDTLAYPIYYSLTIAYSVLVIAYLPCEKTHIYNRIGDYSYGVYIYAFPIQQTLVLFIPDISFLTMFLASLSITLIFATISWHFIESPILNRRTSRKAQIK